MKTIQEYLRHAEECEALIHRSMSEDERVMIRNMAETWRMLADRRRKAIAQAKTNAQANTNAQAKTDAQAKTQARSSQENR